MRIGSSRSSTAVATCFIVCSRVVSNGLQLAKQCIAHFERGFHGVGRGYVQPVCAAG